MFILKTARLLLLAGTLAVGSGCIQYRAPFMPPGGILFTKVKVPLQTEFTAGGAAYSRTAGAISSFYFHDPIVTGLSVAWDDCSVAAAAKKGRLVRVDYADYEFFHVLGIFGKMTVHVYGPEEAGPPSRQPE